MRRFLLSFYIILMVSGGACAGDVDNRLYASVLDQHVSGGLVDYAGLKSDPRNLLSYLDMMGKVNPDSLERNERLAFYINLYNAATLNLIVNHYPVESIKDIGSFFSTPWKRKEVVLNGELVTLDHIEHDIVRPRFREPRVHFALNCSAMSCPILPGVPYEGERLEEQLHDAAVRYINDGMNNYLDGSTLYVSKIFNWFSEDFPEDFVEWFSKFAHGPLKSSLAIMDLQGQEPKVKYLRYNWDLNDMAR